MRVADGVDACDEAVLDAYRHGVPQHRARLFIVAVRDGATFRWPDAQSEPPTLRDAIGDLPPVPPAHREEQSLYLGEPTATLQQRLTALPGRALPDLVNAHPGWLLEANGILHPRGSEYQTQYVIDGLPLTDNRSPAFAAEVESAGVRGLNTLTGGYPAEYGRKLGGVIEVVTLGTARLATVTVIVVSPLRVEPENSRIGSRSPAKVTIPRSKVMRWVRISSRPRTMV